MKHLLKICGLVIVLTCMLVSISFAGQKELFSPVLRSDNGAICYIRNISDDKQIDVTIIGCKDSVCSAPVFYGGLAPGEYVGLATTSGAGSFYCKFMPSDKHVVASICSAVENGCLNVFEKYK